MFIHQSKNEPLIYAAAYFRKKEFWNQKNTA